MTDAELLATPVGFAVSVLGMQPYGWQARVLGWYEGCIGKRVQGTLCTPNGAGKDTVVIAALALWWVFVHKRGRVIITSADGKQIEDQTRPALHKHRGKFDGWDFNQWTITTPTGGRIRLYSTDDPGRVEGAHRDTYDDGTPDPDGPLLIVANEAKSLKDEILDAFDRCTFDGLLYASSPGFMRGRFYESQFKEELNFKRCRVGLKDCPHVPAERIASVIAKYGKDSPFVRSTLDGEFMEASSEQRFDRDGLAILKAQAEVGNRTALIGSLHKGSATSTIQFTREECGWLWLDEEPIIGGEYLFCCDPNTMEQGEGAKDRDNTAGGILRRGYIDERGIEHADQLVAALHWPGGVKWDSDVTAQRTKLLLEWYGNCEAVIEANNFGSAFMKELQNAGVTKIWKRKKVDSANPNKTIDSLGWLTTVRTREHWVQACTKALRCNTDDRGRQSIGLTCRYQQAVDEFHTFIFTPDGRGEAQAGTKDDFVAMLGIGLTVRCFTKLTAPKPSVQNSRLVATGKPGGGWE